MGRAMMVPCHTALLGAETATPGNSWLLLLLLQQTLLLLVLLALL